MKLSGFLMAALGAAAIFLGAGGAGIFFVMLGVAAMFYKGEEA